MIRKQTTIINKLGLHARAASKLVSLTSGYSCQVKIAYNGQQIDGKSIMAVMMLAAGKGAEIELTFDGEDESQACETVCELIDNYFEESE